MSEKDKAAGVDPASSQYRSKFAASAVQRILKQKPAQLYDTASISLITPGNLEDDFDLLADTDWIVEAVPETLKIKQPLFKRLESIHRKGRIVSSNTSGLALRDITAECGEAASTTATGAKEPGAPHCRSTGAHSQPLHIATMRRVSTRAFGIDKKTHSFFSSRATVCLHVAWL